MKSFVRSFSQIVLGNLPFPSLLWFIPWEVISLWVRTLEGLQRRRSSIWAASVLATPVACHQGGACRQTLFKHAGAYPEDVQLSDFWHKWSWTVSEFSRVIRPPFSPVHGVSTVSGVVNLYLILIGLCFRCAHSLNPCLPSKPVTKWKTVANTAQAHCCNFRSLEQCVEMLLKHFFLLLLFALLSVVNSSTSFSKKK